MTDRWGPALYVLLCLIWGSTWLVIKVGYGGLGPFNVAGLRFLIAGALMAVVAQATGVRWPRGRPEWTAVGVVGLLMFAGDYGLIYWAEQYIESGLTAVLFATLPLMTLFIARAYIPGQRITTGKLASSVLAVAGTLLATSAYPNPSSQMIFPPLATASEIDGAWAESSRKRMRWRMESIVAGAMPGGVPFFCACAVGAASRSAASMKGNRAGMRDTRMESSR